MMSVEVHRTIQSRDVLLGHIFFDGARVGTDRPADPTVLMVLRSRLNTPEDGVVLTAATSPEAWLRSLHLKYDNGYIRVTQVREGSPAPAVQGA